jgi:hypothetical protein
MRKAGILNEALFAHVSARKARNYAATQKMQRLVADAMLSHWKLVEEAHPERAKLFTRRAADFAVGKSRAGDRRMYPLSLVAAHSIALASCLPDCATYPSPTGDIDSKGTVNYQTYTPPPQTELQGPISPDAAPPTAARPVRQEHAKWLEFRFVVTRMDKLPTEGGSTAKHSGDSSATTAGSGSFNRRSRVLAVFERSATGDSHDWRTVGSVDSAVPENFRSKLRKDVDLTLIAVTFCHVPARDAVHERPVDEPDAVSSRSKTHRAETSDVAQPSRS